MCLSSFCRRSINGLYARFKTPGIGCRPLASSTPPRRTRIAVELVHPLGHILRRYPSVREAATVHGIDEKLIRAGKHSLNGLTLKLIADPTEHPVEHALNKDVADFHVQANSTSASNASGTCASTMTSSGLDQVLLFDVKDSFVEGFSSTRAAALALGIRESAVRQACLKKDMDPCKGFNLRFADPRVQLCADSSITCANQRSQPKICEPTYDEGEVMQNFERLFC